MYKTPRFTATPLAPTMQNLRKRALRKRPEDFDIVATKRPMCSRAAWLKSTRRRNGAWMPGSAPHGPRR